MMAATYATGKAQRKTLMFFFKVPGDSSPVYEIIGKGIEEAGISQSANVETVVDILGNAETTLDQYEKTTELDPIYVTGDSKFSQWLDEVEEKEKILDDAQATFLVVKAYKTTGESKYVAWEQKAVVELTDFGGGTKGVNLPCTLHWCGPRTFGTFDPSNQTFTVDGSVSAD